MSLNLEHPPFRLGRHRRTVSVRTLDTVLENSISAPSSRPSTASTQSSFQTAFSSLEGSPFRYYLPHISTSSEAVCTKTKDHAFNTLYAPGVQIHQVGRFYHYIPDESTEQDDVYTDGKNFMLDTLHGPGNLHIRPEQKAFGAFKDIRYDSLSSSTEVKSPLSFIRPKDFPYRPEIRVDEEVDVGIGSYIANEDLGTSAVIEAGEMEKRNKLVKEKRGRSRTVADVSEKLKEMLEKLHLRKKVEKEAGMAS